LTAGLDDPRQPQKRRGKPESACLFFFYTIPGPSDRHVDKLFSVQRLILFLKTTPSFSLVAITAFRPGFFFLSRLLGTIDSFIVNPRLRSNTNVLEKFMLAAY
jgi:hypothetical protein